MYTVPEGYCALSVSDLDRYILTDERVCLPNCHKVYRSATQHQCWNCLSEQLPTRAMGIRHRAVTLFCLGLMALEPDLHAHSCLSGPLKRNLGLRLSRNGVAYHQGWVLCSQNLFQLKA